MKKYYCTECGEELSDFDERANEVKVFSYDSGGGSWDRLGNPFSVETGERNYATVYECPRHERKWYGDNNHDIFCIYKGVTYHGIKI